MSARPTGLYTLWQLGVAFAALAAVVLTPRPAHAYTIQSGGTTGCHERLTMAAWRRAAEAFPEATAPLASRGDDAALIADVPFDVPRSFDHIGGVTLLLGVRDNDIKDHGPNGLRELAVSASDPEGQPEHCLRAGADDEPDGSRQAVEACREFIRQALVSALDGLDGAGRPDSSQREKLTVSLSIRGEIDVQVPLFFLRAGRALHAIQDSFTHTFRNPDEPGKIRVVLNFVEYTQDTLVEAVDGPAHASELDECDGLDEPRTAKLELATEASGEALVALLNPDFDRSAKAKAIEKMLDDYVAYDAKANCTAENAWCDAQERSYGSPPLGCQAAALPARGGGLAALAALMALVMLVRTRRLRRVAVAAATLLVLGFATPARADDPKSGPIDSPAKALAGESDAGTPGKVDKAGAFFARVATGASYDNSALSAGLGLRYQMSRKWVLGFDGEWNPYIAVSPRGLRRGSANAYVSLIRRFQLTRETINIRSSVALGGSMLLFDLVGADRYSMGPFFGLSFLGVEWKGARGFYLTVDPTYIAIPIPSIVGVPFMYAQYRFLVGLEFGG